MSSVLSTKADRDRALEASKVERQLALQEQQTEDRYELKYRQQLIDLVRSQEPGKPYMEILQMVQPEVRREMERRQQDRQAEGARKRARTSTVEPLLLPNAEGRSGSDTEGSEDVEFFRD